MPSFSDIATAAQLILSVILVFVTFKLGRRVHKLNAQLDQNLQRLNRMRDLTRDFHDAVEQIDTLRGLENIDISHEKFAQLAGSTVSLLAEIRGLTRAINDSELTKAVSELDNKFKNWLDLKSGKHTVSLIRDTSLVEPTISIHEIVYVLMQKATK